MKALSRFLEHHKHGLWILVLWGSLFHHPPYLSQELHANTPHENETHHANAVRTLYTKMNVLDLQATFNRIAEKGMPALVQVHRAGDTSGNFFISGFIISEDGYIVSAAQFIPGAVLKVVLQNDEIYRGNVFGMDLASGVVLLKINGVSGLPTIDWGDSDDVQIGDIVAATGHPFNLSYSFATGIVSGLERYRIGVERAPEYQRLIQTDTALNTGNQGGPLLNLKGEVIGMNVSIYTKKKTHSILGIGNAGLGFAVPANLIRKVVNELKTKRRFERGWLGIMVKPAENNQTGILIVDVIAGSPAEKNGLRRRDMITKINDMSIPNIHFYTNYMGFMKVGETLRFQVMREETKRSKKDVSIDITLQQKPD